MIWLAIVVSWFVCGGLGFLAAAVCVAAGRADDDRLIVDLIAERDDLRAQLDLHEGQL